MFERFLPMTGPLSEIQPLTFALLALLLLVLILAMLGIFPKHKREERRIKRLVRRLGARTLSNIRIPDGLDGQMFIDHLVLTASSIIVVAVKRYEGFIYAGEALEQWTQVVRQSNFRFPNPLTEMELKILALQSVVPGVAIEGRILFTDGCSFPRRKPDGVLLLSDDIPKAEKRPVGANLQAAWASLREMQRR